MVKLTLFQKVIHTAEVAGSKPASPTIILFNNKKKAEPFLTLPNNVFE